MKEFICAVEPVLYPKWQKHLSLQKTTYLVNIRKILITNQKETWHKSYFCDSKKAWTSSGRQCDPEFRGADLILTSRSSILCAEFLLFCVPEQSTQHQLFNTHQLSGPVVQLLKNGRLRRFWSNQRLWNALWLSVWAVLKYNSDPAKEKFQNIVVHRLKPSQWVETVLITVIFKVLDWKNNLVVFIFRTLQVVGLKM